METPICYSVLLADELALVRDGLAAICGRSERYHVVGRCPDGQAAWEQMSQNPPQLAALDLNLPKLHTLELIRRVRKAELPTRLVILAPRQDRRLMLEALRGGADAFLLKSCPEDQLLDAFHQVLQGQIYVSSVGQLGDLVADSARRRTEDPLQSLSAREHQVLTLLVDGIRCKDIAIRLSLSPKTVDTHRASLMRKLDIYDMAGLVKFAITRKITSVV